MQLWFGSNFFNATTMVLPAYEPFETNPIAPYDGHFETLGDLYPLLTSNPDLTFVTPPERWKGQAARVEEDVAATAKAEAKAEAEAKAAAAAEEARLKREAAEREAAERDRQAAEREASTIEAIARRRAELVAEESANRRQKQQREESETVKQLTARVAQLEQSAVTQLAEKDAQLAAVERRVAEQDAEVAALNARLRGKDTELATAQAYEKGRAPATDADADVEARVAEIKVTLEA